MNRSAFFRRAGVVFFATLLLTAFSSCAGIGNLSGSSNTGSVQAVEAAQTGIDTGETALNLEPVTDALPFASASASRVLVRNDRTSFGLELIEGPDTNQLVVLPPTEGRAPAYKVMRLENPARVVLDLNESQSSLNRTINTVDSELLDRVRVAAYPDKSRVVVDLPRDIPVAHKIETTEDQRIVLTLSKEGSRQASISEPLPMIEEQKIEVASQEPAASPAGTGTAPQVLGMQIQPLGANENMLLIQSTGKVEPQLRQTAPSEYVLNLPGTALSDAAGTTLLAPRGAGAIHSARSIPEGDNVTVRIFASPEKKLGVRAGDSKIIIAAEAMTDEAQVRAQMSPQAAPAKPAAKPSPAAKAPANAPAPAAAPPAVSDDSEVSALLQETPKYTGRLISLDLQDTDIDNALRIIAEVSNLNIIASEDVAGKVTLRLIDVPWDQALDVILKTNGLDKVQEGNVIRIAPVEKLRQEREALKQAQQAEQELEPLQVRYVRVSYAKASELKPLVEAVLSERGTVHYDERTNQLIIKDIRSGLKNVGEMAAKIDLRTPQVLLETEIVEANRTLLRDLGAELGFSLVQSPATGNPTGWNFPNSINVSGSADATTGGTMSSFPAAGGSGITFLLDSADGTRSLSARLSALENEGRVRVISRPAVATTNNKAATIKSVEKIRIKVPSGGLSVATGQGASASGSSTTATETVEVGIVLEVTPQASPDYFVLLDINAKSSTLGSTFVDGIPSEIERSATSSVLVSSGQTFAMGGIYKITESDRIRGVPFFKDIPFLGHFFRELRTDNSDEELLFFLTPRIIEGSFDDAAMRGTL